MRLAIGFLTLVGSSLGVAPYTQAQEPRIDFGIGVAIDAADGTPANDIPNAGILVRYHWSERWLVGASVHRAEYDYERPAEIVGITQDPTVEVIDALAEATVVRGWVERSLFDESRPMRFFVGAGLGAAFTDVPDVAGPRADGGQFDIATEVDTEIIVSALGGLGRHFGERWYAEAAVRLEQHFADWRSVDRVSGAEGHIDDYLTWGIQISLAYTW
jgi:hypothetical protein